jgi:hypothetical protein
MATPAKKTAVKKTAAKKATRAPRKTAAARKATQPARDRSARSDELLERLVRQAEHAGQTVLIERRDYSATGGRPSQSMAAADPEVTKLEAPFRRASKPQPTADGGPVNE